MRWLLFIQLALACSAATKAPIGNPAGGRQVHDSIRSDGELATAADEALAELSKPDYRRPFVSADIDYAQVRGMYLVACRGGDRRSCWMVAQLRELATGNRDDAADKYIADNCAAGDMMSCRALMSTSTTHTPGWAGRSATCRDDHGCDIAELRRECRLGLPVSCGVALQYDSSDADVAVDKQRTLELARQGCQRGLVDECEILASDGSRRDKMLAYDQRCKMSGHDCSRFDHDESPIEARDRSEHACQWSVQGHRETLCAELVVNYAKHVWPEPVPNRFVDLRDWYCRKPALLDTDELCKHADLNRVVTGQ